MFKSKNLFRATICLIIFTLMVSTIFAQKNSKQLKGKPVLWERVNIKQRDLFLGPGGNAMRPDLRRITFIKKQKGGTSLKYRIKDGSGREWVAKIDKESQPETASVRLTWALGYKSEINYLVPSLTIPGKGTFKNVRLEARPENIEREGRWNWDDNPFSGTNELQGLKIMMALLNNWDLKESNTVILRKGNELQYTISDLGATFGDYGNNSLPIIYRLGRSINRPLDYSKSSFIKGVEDEMVNFSFKGKQRKLFDDVTVEHARWVANLLTQLSDKQIRDAFRAANYSPDDINILTQAFKNRIKELDRVGNGQKLAKSKR